MMSARSGNNPVRPKSGAASSVMSCATGCPGPPTSGWPARIRARFNPVERLGAHVFRFSLSGRSSFPERLSDRPMLSSGPLLPGSRPACIESVHTRTPSRSSRRRASPTRECRLPHVDTRPRDHGKASGNLAPVEARKRAPQKRPASTSYQWCRINCLGSERILILLARSWRLRPYPFATGGARKFFLLAVGRPGFLVV